MYDYCVIIIVRYGEIISCSGYKISCWYIDFRFTLLTFVNIGGRCIVKTNSFNCWNNHNTRYFLLNIFVNIRVTLKVINYYYYFIFFRLFIIDCGTNYNRLVLPNSKLPRIPRPWVTKQIYEIHFLNYWNIWYLTCRQYIPTECFIF